MPKSKPKVNTKTKTIPKFGYPGGKARLASWLIDFFPKSSRFYFEPFAGRGNVFFRAFHHIQSRKFIINDLITAPFFRTLKKFDVDSLPESVTREDFEIIRREQSDLSIVLEPRITFMGGGYKVTGYGAGDRKGAIGYRRESYKKTILAAKGIINSGDVYIIQKNWEDLYLLFDRLTKDDFVYLDPPYYQKTDTRYFPEINHTKLLEMLKCAKFKWILSGYDSDLYRKYIGEPFATKTRIAEMKTASLKGEKKARLSHECIWKNF